MKIAAVAFVFAVAVSVGVARANENPSFQKPTDFSAMSGSENAFVASMQADLTKRFPTAADAEKAGYVRYTNPDDTGAISYANQQWQSTDVHHPSQLWYDKNGNLLGADYSRLKTGATPPKLWGIKPGRWWEFDRHMHYVLKDSTGKMTYDRYLADDDWLKAGGSLTNPQAATLVKLGNAKSADEVATLFNFPMVWDLIVWVVPNPKGAFAFTNPSVKP
jgi:hypothetical protein